MTVVNFATSGDVSGGTTSGNTSAITIGSSFTFPDPGTLSSLRLYVTVAGTYKMRLYDASGTVLATPADQVASGAGWLDFPLTTPFLALPGNTYIAAGYFPTGQWRQIALTNPTSRSGIVWNGSAYNFATGITFPSTSDPSNFYMPDVAYEVLTAAALVAHYKLDESSGATTFADSSGNSRAATVNGVPTFGGAALASGIPGTSVSFASPGGVHQYGAVASPPWFRSLTALSIKAWFKTSASGSNQAIVSMDNVFSSPGSADRKFALYLDSTGKLTFINFTSSGGFPFAATAGAYNDGVEHQVIATRSATTLKIYVDGTLAASQAVSGTLSGNNVNLIIGEVTGLLYQFIGSLDDIELYAGELTSTEVAAIYADESGTGGTTGAVAGTAPAPTLAVAGTVTLTGDVAATAPAPTLAVTGDVAGVVTGTVASTAPAPTLVVTGDVIPPASGEVSATAPAPTLAISDSTDTAEISVAVTVEVGALTLLDIVTLDGVEVPVGLGVESGDTLSVVPLAGVSIELGVSLIGRQNETPAPDPRRQATQWNYRVTDLDNVPLGELMDIEHDPVEDGIGEPGTMQFTIATDSDQHDLILPIQRQLQVWDGDVLRLKGPILPGQASEDGATITYKVHDPSWFWRDGRRVITRIPQKNLLHNGDFKSGLTYWTRGYDSDSIPAAAPAVTIVNDDFADDEDGLDPIKAAQIAGVESVTESELSSNAVFYPNRPFAWEPLDAGFRPGGEAAIEAVADDMPTTAGLKVTIIGHTANDGTGSGLELSLRRANAAKAVVQAKRPNAVITTKGVGFYDPKPGFPVDSQEQRRVVIQYDQTITGESKQWIRQTVEVTQPKAARYPLVLTAAAMLKIMDDWSVEDANMVSVKITVRRKSAPTRVWDTQKGQGSASISDTDPIGRWIPQTAEAIVPADDRPYYVDVYLYAPAALARYTAVGLFPEEELYFWGVDQALIFKGIMEHIQDPDFGHGDLGVLTRTPLTGIKRDREFHFRDLTAADTALDGLMGISRGLEWDTVTTPTTTTATTFYPRMGKTVDYVLALGGNVVRAVPATTRDVGSSIIAQAQGLGSYRAVAYAKDTRAFGGTLLERVITAEQETPLNELRETAKAELFWAKTSTPAYWVDIDPEFIEEVKANTAKGDTVRLILDRPTEVDALARIVRRQTHPNSLRLMVAFEEA